MGKSARCSRWLLAGAILAAAPAGILPAHAAAIPYSCPHTDSQLRSDIAAAGKDGTVLLWCSNASTVGFAAQIAVPVSVTIDASHSPKPIIFDGNRSTQLFYVGYGLSLTLVGVTVAHGADGGQAIVADRGSTLDLTNDSFVNNSSYGNAGGSVYADGALTVTGTSFTGNAGGENPGGIQADVNSVSSISSSSFASNTGTTGGAVSNAGIMTLSGDTFFHNVAAEGGAVENAATLTVSVATFLSNSAPVGGALYATTSSLTIVTGSAFGGNTGHDGGAVATSGATSLANSTLAGNAVSGSNSAGGAIFAYSAHVTVIDVTIWKNAAASGYGGGIYNNRSSVTIGGTIVAANTPANCSNPANLGTFTDDGYNLEDDSTATCGFTGARHDILGQNPNLDPNGLKNNGGPTPTVALLPASPAIDRGWCGFTYPNTTPSAPITTDQRGVTRPQGANCDIGAYEYIPV